MIGLFGIGFADCSIWGTTRIMESGDTSRTVVGITSVVAVIRAIVVHLFQIIVTDWRRIVVIYL